jgi:integrase
MNRLAFSKVRLDALKPPTKGRVYYYDTKVAGLALCVTAASRKTFYFCKRVNGPYQRVVIGRHPDLGVEQARHEAARLTGEIAGGGDPQRRKRTARAEMTLGELFVNYMEVYARAHKRPRSWQEDEKQFKRYLGPLAGHKVSAISQADVRRLHTGIGRNHGTYAANRLLALLSTMFNVCASNLPNPVKGVRRFEEQSRDRYLDGDELQRFFEALRAEPNEAWRDAFVILLLSGARKSNVLGMRWTDVDLGRGLWKIPGAESKNRKAMICVLAPPVVEILRRRRADNGESVFVFAGAGKSGHLEEPKKAWRAILKRADLLDDDGKNTVRVHDLRRTMGSWQAGLGASLPIIGASLGHRSTASTAVYARVNVDPVRRSVEAAAEAIMAAGNGQKMLPAPRKGVTAKTARQK